QFVSCTQCDYLLIRGDPLLKNRFRSYKIPVLCRGSGGIIVIGRPGEESSLLGGVEIKSRLQGKCPHYQIGGVFVLAFLRVLHYGGMLGICLYKASHKKKGQQ